MPPLKVLDLGVDNSLADRMRQRGYDVTNTPMVDLDFAPETVAIPGIELVTAFEILEHLINPFGVLREITAPRLVATVPTRLWFAKAFRNPEDVFDQHFHEFEPWQFDRLLEKSGWDIVRQQQWTARGSLLGIRPLLRHVTPRYYAVEAVRRIPTRPS